MTDRKLNISQTKSAIIDLQREAHSEKRYQDGSKADTVGSRLSGQNLAGSGALVFEGELLEISKWN